MQNRSKQRDVSAANMAQAVGASQRHQNRRGDFYNSGCFNCSKTPLIFLFDFVPEVM